MSDFKVGAGDDTDARALESNMQAVEGWQKRIARLAPVTQNHYSTHVNLFLSRLDDLLVTDLTPGIWRQYLTQASLICRFLRRRPGDEQLCLKDRDLAGCGTQCGGYEPTRVSTLDAHVRAISSLFGYLDFENYVPVNFVPQVYKEFKVGLGRSTEEDAKYYCPSLEDVQELIAGTEAEPRHTLYTFMAKTGSRIEETATLEIGASQFDLDEGLVTYDGRRKRQGNPYAIIDRELTRKLEDYLEWRARVAQPNVKRLFVTPHGEGLSVANLGKLNERWWQKDAISLGLQDADAPRGRRWHSHSMRHFFSDHISESGINSLYYHVLRGDKVKGTLGTYTEHTKVDRIRREYARHAPILGV